MENPYHFVCYICVWREWLTNSMKLVHIYSLLQLRTYSWVLTWHPCHRLYRLCVTWQHYKRIRIRIFWFFGCISAAFCMEMTQYRYKLHLCSSSERCMFLNLQMSLYSKGCKVQTHNKGLQQVKVIAEPERINVFLTRYCIQVTDISCGAVSEATLASLVLFRSYRYVVQRS